GLPAIKRNSRRQIRVEPVALGRHAIAAAAAVVALAAAVEHRSGTAIGAESFLAEKALADGAGGAGCAGIESRQGIARRRRRDRRADRLRKAELCRVDGAEGRSEGGLLRAVDDRRSNSRSSEVVVADPARQQHQDHNAEAEGGL